MVQRLLVRSQCWPVRLFASSSHTSTGPFAWSAGPPIGVFAPNAGRHRPGFASPCCTVRKPLQLGGMHMKRLVKLTISVAVLAWLLIPSSGYAQDTKVFPGVSCQPFNGEQVPGLQWHPASLSNFSEAGRLVTCPIVRDCEVQCQSLFIQATVQSAQRQQLTCFIFTQSFFGTTIAAESMNTNNNFPTTLFWNIALSGSDVFYYNLICALPSGGRIFHYIVTE
jgi:hypothetical protein